MLKMSVIYDEMTTWLTDEIEKPLPPHVGGRSIQIIFKAKIRRMVLEEVKKKFVEIVEREITTSA